MDASTWRTTLSDTIAAAGTAGRPADEAARVHAILHAWAAGDHTTHPSALASLWYRRLVTARPCDVCRMAGRGTRRVYALKGRGRLCDECM
jgi:hypothetical protein